MVIHIIYMTACVYSSAPLCIAWSGRLYIPDLLIQPVAPIKCSSAHVSTFHHHQRSQLEGLQNGHLPFGSERQWIHIPVTVLIRCSTWWSCFSIPESCPLTIIWETVNSQSLSHGSWLNWLSWCHSVTILNDAIWKTIWYVHTSF